jgi:hypothetical protein
MFSLDIKPLLACHAHENALGRPPTLVELNVEILKEKGTPKVLDSHAKTSPSMNMVRTCKGFKVRHNLQFTSNMLMLSHGLNFDYKIKFYVTCTCID